jgi:hypothetical protein
MRTQPPAPATQHEQDNPGHRVIAVEIDGADYGCITCGKTWRMGKLDPMRTVSPFGGLVDGVPRVCSMCMTDPAVTSSTKYQQFLRGDWYDAPGVDYRCIECGVRWSTVLEQNNVMATGQIDWTQPQPEGTYRCEDGWSSNGAEFGCMKRADTTCSNGELRCTQHALIFEITGIREAMVAMQDRYAAASDDTDHFQAELLDSLKDISAALWDTNYTHMSLTRRAWYRARAMWDRRADRVHVGR